MKQMKRVLSFIMAVLMIVQLLPMNVLAEYLLPFARVGGRMLALKGPTLDEELAGARNAIEALGGGVGFEEAELTFLCRKLYQGPFEREGLADVIGQGIYKNWQPHWMFVVEILETEDRR